MIERRYKVIRSMYTSRSEAISITLSPGQIWTMQRKDGEIFEMTWKCVTMRINADQLDRCFRAVDEKGESDER